MTALELLELMRQAQRVTNTLGLILEARDSGFDLYKQGPGNEDLHGATADQVISTLKEWATPPKPETVTITIPYRSAEWAVHSGSSVSSGHPSESITNACREAIEPWLPPKQ